VAWFDIDIDAIAAALGWTLLLLFICELVRLLMLVLLLVLLLRSPLMALA
jgi:hypothetical protein